MVAHSRPTEPPPLPKAPEGLRRDETCETCGGIKFVQAPVDVGDPQFGKPIPCPTCTDYLAISGLSQAEQEHKLDDIRSIAPIHTVLRVLGKQLLKDPWGWITLYGAPYGPSGTLTGNSKSFFGTALAAEFCRRGIRAIYKHAGDLSQQLYRDLDGDKGNESLLRSVRVLVIDEMQDIHATSWLVGKWKAILEHRFRYAEPTPEKHHVGLLTIIIGQMHPDLWVDGDGTCWVPPAWVSRMSDGRFNIPWPDGVEVPQCDQIVKDYEDCPWIPGLIAVSAPDIRPHQFRKIYQSEPGTPGRKGRN